MSPRWHGPRPSQVDMPPGHILSWNDHSGSKRLSSQPPGPNREFKVINTEALWLKPTVEELAGGRWTDWQREWQREEEPGGSVGGERNAPEVREQEWDWDGESVTEWNRGRECEGSAGVLLMCCREEEKCCLMQGVGGTHRGRFLSEW